MRAGYTQRLRPPHKEPEALESRDPKHRFHERRHSSPENHRTEAMKTHTRAVVIGGGVVGVSTLYHLAKKGWSDVVLLERGELTGGAPRHGGGLLPLFNMSYTVGQLHKYSVDLYKRLPGETGQEVSFHVNGNLRSEERRGGK